MTINKVCIKPATCAVDLSDGSERGLYVNQDYILRKLNRPHRAVNIMFCYYPLDEAWPKRVQDAYSDMEVNYAWAYPYDNYFPYEGGITGNTDGEPFKSMRDIRRHGQDVILTLTCDSHISDEHIIGIAKDLKCFGRMMLRLNHECTGNWFSYTKRASYREIADFYVRFHNIIRKYAPNVKMILCAGASDSPDNDMLEREEDFTDAVRDTDIWSIDKYIALNWGWPYEVAEKNNNQHKLDGARFVCDVGRKTFKRLMKLCDGKRRPLVMSELNADGDVTGPYDQVDIMREFCDIVKHDRVKWLSGFCFYQFRDDGRLGLEITDPNNPDVGIEQPMLEAYRDIISDKYFSPMIKKTEKAILPLTLRWGGSEDAEGVQMSLKFKKNPVFAEANFNGLLKDANLMLELDGFWFYKAPGVTFVDFMPYFFKKKHEGSFSLKLNIFAPPADGVNLQEQGADWQENYYYELKELPEIRLRFEPICK